MGNTCGSEVTREPDTICIEYFNVHGRGDPIKALLHHNGTAFVEENVSIPNYLMRKARGSKAGEFGSALPVVHYQGKSMQQVGAVMRALAIERGYYNPRDWRQAMKIDWVIDTWGEMLDA